MHRYLLLLSIITLHCQSSTPSPVTTVPERVKDALPEAAPEATSPSSTPASPTQVTKDELMGRFVPAQHPDFVPVGKPYSARAGMLLRKEAFEAFKKMFEAAQKDGIALNIISSTRNFDQQKTIWEEKWRRFEAQTPDARDRALRILEYSSMPGTSRHHWGTDIDLNDLNNPAFEGNGKYRKVYDWLVKNAATYGFGQPYTPKGPDRPNGYNEEKWHWSYLPIARPYRAEYLKYIKNDAIAGFKGSDTATGLDVVKNYVGGVSAACQ